MENFNEVVDEALNHCLQQLKSQSLDIESILTVYYIKEHLKEQKLTSENIFLIGLLKSEIKQNLVFKLSNDIKYLIFWLLLNLVNDGENEDKHIKDFFSVYLFFEEYKNIIDNVDLIKLIFPDKKTEEFFDNLEYATENCNFWELPLFERKKVIYKLFYITSTIYERSVEPFKKFHKFLYKIYIEAIKRDEEEIVFFLYTPLLFTWSGVSTSQSEFKHFNDNIELKLESYIKEKMVPRYKLKPTQRIVDKSKPIKVVFLQERLINYSIHKVFTSLLKYLSQSKNLNYEFIVLDLNFKELGGSQDHTQNEIKKLGFKFIDCHNLFTESESLIYPTVEKALKIREWLIDNEIDVLIGMHTRPEYNFLFTSRTCPKQVYWSHGNFEYNISSIDKKICHFKDKHIEYSSYEVFSVQPDISLLDPIVNKQEVNLMKESFPVGNVVLGSLGRLSKSNNHEYLDAIIEIMKQNPNTIFLMCGVGEHLPIKEYLLKEPEVLNRVYFPGQVNGHIYGHIIDVFLDTWPHRHGSSVDEFQAKGRCVISFGKYLPSYVINDWDSIFKEKGYKNYFTAKSISEYINIASELIDNESLRVDIGKLYRYHRVEKPMENIPKNIEKFYNILGLGNNNEY